VNKEISVPKDVEQSPNPIFLPLDNHYQEQQQELRDGCMDYSYSFDSPVTTSQHLTQLKCESSQSYNIATWWKSDIASNSSSVMQSLQYEILTLR
jgi:hypothetical protein